MTTTTSTPMTASDAADRRTSYLAGAATYAVVTVGTVVGADSTGEVLVVLAVCAVVAAWIYGRVVPRRLAAGAPGTALALGIVAALLFVPAFWSGLPILLGVAAVLLGLASRPRGRGRAIAAVVLGALASAAYVYAYVDELVTGRL